MTHPTSPARRMRGATRHALLLRLAFVAACIAVIAIVFWPRAAAAMPQATTQARD